LRRIWGSLDGGEKKKPKSYELAARQVLKAVGGNISSLTKDNVLNTYVATNTGSKSLISVKTTQNKLKGLEYFCKFLMSPSRKRLLDNIGSECHANLMRLQNALPGWRSSLSKRALVDDVKRQVKDYREKITAEECNDYLQCEFGKYAHTLLLNAQIQPSAKMVCTSHSDFVNSRNHLLILIILSNATRAGVLTNFTLIDYEAGLKKVSLIAPETVFTVVEHKTVATHGAATFAVNKEELLQMAGYINLQKKLQISDAQPFFL